MCTAGSAKRERSRRAERPDASSEGDEEAAGIDSGAAYKKAGGTDDEQVAERVEPNLVFGAITVFINQTLGGQKGFVSTLELQLVALRFCVICRHVPSLTLRVGKRAMRHQKSGLNSSSRVPALRPSAIRGQYVKEAILSKHHKRIDCRSASGIKFGKQFDEPIAGVPWPCSLRQLEFGRRFDQAIVSVEWPRSLQKLTFDGLFNQPVEGISWPSDLRELDFGLSFNRPIEDVAWPKSLRAMRFGPCFNQPIEQVLIFGDDFNKPIEGTKWPSSLKKFTLGLKFEQSIANVSWPQAFEHLHLENVFYDFSVEDMLWLPSLRYVTMGEDTVFKSIAAIHQDSGSGSEASWATMGAAAAGDNLSESVSIISL
ncbi:conserved unknown protein [Ectocarpus siliculosus]|uniref:Uncharacterized protein n=1 Tax=Ectocarpus siliculosus TaxID=2880 RepID=D8LD35_ECTSI|nr:conserved unknown protein [Ectocarpus siliculosus]|eukprot:CBN78402.1 conserved unknown protein [Ectocarpus siliculosus]